MSFASPKTTNNSAEFQGLIVGLRAAAAHNWHPLTVVGDSNMILTLMRRKTPPKAPSLKTFYHQARQATATIRVTGWHHHYRAYNKMPDKAANIAMDARRSFQAFAQDSRPELAPIQALLSNDVAPWTERLMLSPPPRPTIRDDEAVPAGSGSREDR